MKKSIVSKLKIFFLFILIIVTRFTFLSSVPSSLTQDEIAIGYNAFSILKTGHDEWGETMPLQFKSVGDYKPPTLIYLTAPFISLFGKTEIATRLPVAIFSSLTVFLFYLLCSKHIFAKKYKHLSYYSTLVLSISPWHIFFSRSGFEAILGLFFALLFVYFLLNFIKKSTAKDLLAIIFSGLVSAITYHSTRLFIPILTIFFLPDIFRSISKLINNRSIIKKINLVILLLFGSSLAFWFFRTYLTGAGVVRAKMVFINIDYEYNRILVPFVQGTSFEKISKLYLLILFWYKRYLGYFLPNFYLTTGLGLTFPQQPGQGVIYSIEFIALIIGTLSLLNRNFCKKIFLQHQFTKKLIIVWILLGFLPASLANNPQHALRSMIASLPIYVLIIIGFSAIYQFIKNTKQKLFISMFYTLIIIGYSMGIIHFADNYLVHYYRQFSEFRHFGWKEMANYANQNAQYYNNVYVDHRFGSEGPQTYGVPYYYFLFYSDTNPTSYNQDPIRSTNTADFGNFKFQAINWFGIDHSGNNLYIGSPWSFPSDQIKEAQIRYKLYYPNGKLGLMAVSDTYQDPSDMK